MIQPEELIGHTVDGRFAIRSYRGQGCAGWIFVADQAAQNPCAGLGAEFGGGAATNPASTRVILEISQNGPSIDARQLENLRDLYPHDHLLRCLEVGQCRDESLAGASYLTTEIWRETLAETIARRPRMAGLEVQRIATEIAAALARYHSNNRMHGDVRAQRICQVDGHWKLAPFLNGDGSGTGSCDGCRRMPHDDIYALGLILLRCLSPKFGRDRENTAPGSTSHAEIKWAISELPESWRNWLGRCLAAEPSQRCSAAELAVMGDPVPPLLGDVVVNRVGDHYRLQWQSPQRGTVRVYRWRQAKCPLPREVWLVAELERIGDNVPLTTPTEAQLKLELGSNCQVVVASTLGKVAVIGDSISLTWAVDVQNLKASANGKSLEATWKWPDGVFAADVVVREGRFAQGRDDRESMRKRCFRAGYSVNERFDMRIDKAEGLIHVTVYAIHVHEQGWEWASGRTNGARTTVSFSSGCARAGGLRARGDRSMMINRAAS